MNFALHLIHDLIILEEVAPEVFGLSVEVKLCLGKYLNLNLLLLI